MSSFPILEIAGSLGLPAGNLLLKQEGKAFTANFLCLPVYPEWVANGTSTCAVAPVTIAKK